MVAHEYLSAGGERPGYGHVEEDVLVRVGVRGHGDSAEADQHCRNDEALHGVAEGLQCRGNADLQYRNRSFPDFLCAMAEGELAVEAPAKEDAELEAHQYEQDARSRQKRQDGRESYAAHSPLGKNAPAGHERPVERYVEEIRDDRRRHVPVGERF